MNITDSNPMDNVEIIDPVATTEVAEYRATEAGLIKLRQRLKGKTYDLSTTDGDRAARADRRELVSLRTGVEAIRKEKKAPLLAAAKMLDDEARRITGEILALETPIDAAIKADESRREAERQAKAQAERRRVENHISRIQSIGLAAQKSRVMQPATVRAGIEWIEAIDIEAEAFEEFAPQAGEAKAVALQDLRDWLATVEAQEAEAKRLTEERAALEREREEERKRIAAEAAERQKRIDAEEAERRARQRAEDEARAKAEAERLAKIRTEEQAAAAERARAQAEHDAKMQAEREALEAERRRQDAIRAEQERQEAEQRRLAAEQAEARDRELLAARRRAVWLAYRVAELDQNDPVAVASLIDEASAIVTVIGEELSDLA